MRTVEDFKADSIEDLQKQIMKFLKESSYELVDVKYQAFAMPRIVGLPLAMHYALVIVDRPD